MGMERSMPILIMMTNDRSGDTGTPTVTISGLSLATIADDGGT
jgi:hypothetical protein